MKKMKIGFVGVGAISGIYLENITNTFREIEIAGVCDLVKERAEAAAEKYGIPKVYDSVDELLADPEVDIVLNLTRPYEHYKVTMAALRAGKHVYSEKPLAASLEEGREIMEFAAKTGLFVGGAPDTFLGSGIQTCRKLIDDGYIGKPIGVAAFMICRGHESWHPDPDFYYQYGGGPLFDMGPYYLTAFVNLLGPVAAVSAMTETNFATRTITSEPHFGETIEVHTPTHIMSNLRFVSGATGTLFTTFDVHYPAQARFEVYGSEGTLFVPDPNDFGGPVKLYRPEQGEVVEVPLCFPYSKNSRALGLADMAKALTERDGKWFRANSRQTFHVLEVMDSILKSGREHREIEIESRFEKMPPMATGLLPGVLDS